MDAKRHELDLEHSGKAFECSSNPGSIDRNERRRDRNLDLTGLLVKYGGAWYFCTATKKVQEEQESVPDRYLHDGKEVRREILQTTTGIG